MKTDGSDTPGADSFVSVFGKTIYVTGMVDDRMAHHVIRALDQLDVEEGPTAICLNSGGGEESAGYAIYDAIRQCDKDVIIQGFGIVASIAAAIFQAADLRLLSPNSKFLIHNGHFDGIGAMQQDAVVSLAHEIEKDSKRYYEILAGRSKNSVDVINRMCDKESWFTAREAVAQGFADEVLKPLKVFKKKKKGQ
jgi:ATP-dependent Clp endopeptidase proteolytic subunit ClpP